MSRIEVYFDESGSHQGAPALCLAGYIVDADEAEQLAAEWASALSRFNLPYFRMSECDHGNGACSALSMNNRITLASDLIDIIKRLTVYGLGATVNENEYNDLMPYHRNMGGAYTLCVFTCLHGVQWWAREAGFGGNASYFFESGHRSQREANRIMNLSRRVAKERGEVWPIGYKSHAFVDKRTSAAVQAADLFAWQLFTDRKKVDAGKPRRKDFESMLSTGQYNAVHIDRDRILGLVDTMNRQNAWGKWISRSAANSF